MISGEQRISMIRVEIKNPDGRYGHEILTAELRDLPFEASEDDIQRALDTTEIIVEGLRERIRNQIANVRQEKTLAPAKPPAAAVNLEAFKSSDSGIDIKNDIEPVNLSEPDSNLESATENIKDDIETEEDLDEVYRGTALEITEADRNREAPPKGPACPECDVELDTQGNCTNGFCESKTRKAAANVTVVTSDEMLAAKPSKAKGKQPEMVVNSETLGPEKQEPFISPEIEAAALSEETKVGPTASGLADALQALVEDFKAEPAEIPAEDDVLTHLDVLGIQVPMPPIEWTLEKLTEVNADGEGGGQMRAINTVLTGFGYGGALRHPAALALIKAAFGQLARAELGSIKDLTKAEASVILNWAEQAGPLDIVALGEAVKGGSACLV